MEEDAKENASQKRRRGTRGGLLMIALGLISAIWVYFSDSNSLDFTRMVHAWDFAVLHAVLWTVAGLLVIGWYNRPLDGSSALDTPDDRPGPLR